MYTDQIPHIPRFPNKASPRAKPHLAKSDPVRSPAVQDEQQTAGWGLTFSLNHDENKATGRPAGTASWEGIANLFWFADRKTGLGGMIGSQILPYGGMFSSPLTWKGRKESWVC